MSDIFEQPWTLLIAAIAVLLAALIFRSILPEKRHWWQLALPAFLIAAAFGLDFLVQTDLEKINTVINTMVEAVEEEDPDAIETIISDNYRDSYHNSKEILMYYCRVKLSEPLVEKNIKRVLAIEISPPKTAATAIFTVRTVFDKQSYVYQNFKRIMLTKIKLDLRKGPGNNWLVSRAEILEIGGQAAKWRDIKQTSW